MKAGAAAFNDDRKRPTVFGVFETISDAQQAAEILKGIIHRYLSLHPMAGEWK
jgi:hypothetical protein